jgi:Tfp pilus assembly protein PilZ
VDMIDIRIRTKTADETPLAAEDFMVKMLNLGGVLMEGGHLHEFNRTLLMEIALPDNVRISLTGRVTSCLPVKAKDGRYDVGIEFISMIEQDRTKLKKFIHWLYLKDAGFTE